jgi:hypothetical protein
MNETTVPVYRMNPATDRIIFGDELEEGMLVLYESPTSRGTGTEDEQIREQRFRRVTRLQIRQRYGTPFTVFVGEWVDGYQEVHDCAITTAWLVRKGQAGQEEDAPS